MEIKIYLDVLFLNNLILDWLLLYITSLLLRRSVSFIRLLWVSALGALVALMQFFLPDASRVTLPVGLMIGAILVIACFRPKSLRVFIKYICVFYVCLFTTGGLAFFFFYNSGMASHWGSVYRNGIVYVNFPVYLFLPIFFLCRYLLKTAWMLGLRLAGNQKQLLRIQVTFGGKVCVLTGFYDSGNFLCEKTSGTGVIIGAWTSLKSLFPKELSYNDLCQPNAGFTRISYRSLKENSSLPAFLPDNLAYEKNGSFTKTEPLYIAIINQALDAYHTWDAILPRDFEGVNHIETITQSVLPTETKDSSASPMAH